MIGMEQSKGMSLWHENKKRTKLKRKQKYGEFEVINELFIFFLFALRLTSFDGFHIAIVPHRVHPSERHDNV